MKIELAQPARCGLDTAEISRLERLLRSNSPKELSSLFTAAEIDDAGMGAGQAASLAARFAAKEACCKLFPRETALGLIQPGDFAVRRDSYGAPGIVANGRAQAILDRHCVASIRVSLTHTETNASALAWTVPRTIDVTWFGKWLYRLLPYRRQVVLGNLRRVFGE